VDGVSTPSAASAAIQSPQPAGRKHPECRCYRP
jgi:hypothetical protein